MSADDLAPRMRTHEIYHRLQVPPGSYAIVRADGRGFSRLTAERFEKPFDPRFHAAMVETATTLLGELDAIYVYTESDEISALLPRSFSLFDREVEKLVSIAAGIASAAFTHAAATPAHFDARVWVGATEPAVHDYFAWRQCDAARCALHGACYWALRKTGASAGAATAQLEGKTISEKNELLYSLGTNFNDLPAWQKRGVGLCMEEYQREGYNPITQEKVLATRRRVAVIDPLPMREEHDALLEKLLQAAIP